jgi:FixJ family two-component response regulator
MAASDCVVFVVDGEATARSSTAALVSSLGLECQTFSSAKQFLDTADFSRPGCVVVDLHLPGMDAFQLQEHLAGSGHVLPTIIVGANMTVKDAVRAMHEGAVSVLEKPCNGDALNAVICRAATIARDAHAAHRRLENLQTRFESLDLREREVMTLIVTGVPNKTIARELGVCQRTAAQIRADVFEKMDVESAVDLAILVGDLRWCDHKGIITYANVSAQLDIPLCAG